MMHRGETPVSVRDTNLLVLVPTSDRYATVELFAIRAGRLVIQRVVGLKAQRAALAEELESLFGAGAPSGRFSEHELDELRIITSWVHQHRDRSHVVTVESGSIDTQLRDAFASVAAMRTTAPSEYSQLPEDDGAAH